MSSTPLPDLYAKWMEAALGTELPAEPRATCHDCVMCKGAAPPADLAPKVRFSPNSKCCTYTYCMYRCNLRGGMHLRVR
jgi:hypothetical protein